MAKKLTGELGKERTDALDAGRTVVVNVRREECDVYVGRKHPRAPKVEGSDGRFGNESEMFTKDFLERIRTDKAYRKDVEETLQGKRIGCWCFPKYCHAMVLAVWCNCTPLERRRLLKMDPEAAWRALYHSANHWWGA